MKNTLIDRFQNFMLRFHQLGGEMPPLENYGITPAQVVYLDHLSRNPMSRLGDLADALHYKPASVSAMVSALESKGLVSKDQGQDDGRALSLSLTKKGHKVVTELSNSRNERLSEILENLDEDEKESLLRLLEKTLLKEEK